MRSFLPLTILASTIIAKGAPAVPLGLFNGNATGRVTPIGEFLGFQDSFEYLFGLAPLPSGSPSNSVISNAALVGFTSGCPEVTASTVYLTLSTINPDNSTGPFISISKQVCTIAKNKKVQRSHFSKVGNRNQEPPFAQS
ncbi:hypothetical protein DFH09DRAFT_1459339 [Mycena vulgaris]|nr:hypothetical protein DFH09DRAFT_1459339 [Mycena vulgaris]